MSNTLDLNVANLREIALFFGVTSEVAKAINAGKPSSADDTKVFATINNPSDCDDLQSDLDNIYSWSSDNMMFNQ